MPESEPVFTVLRVWALEKEYSSIQMNTHRLNLKCSPSRDKPRSNNNFERESIQLLGRSLICTATGKGVERANNHPGVVHPVF